MAYVLFRYLHFAAIIVFAGCLIVENVAVGQSLNREDRRNLRRVDQIYGLSAMLVLLFGLTLWFGVGKPAEFYSQNPVFHAKVGLFVFGGLSSLVSTLFIFRQSRVDADSVDVPAAIRWALRAQLVIVLIIPVLAWLMARGVGLSGS